MSSLFIVDGNNLIHCDPALARAARQDFDAARRALVAKLDPHVGVLASGITIVFDGQKAGPAHEFRSFAVHVQYAAAAHGADAVIERMVADARDPSQITVVTSDIGEQHAVAAFGGCVMSCEMLLSELERERADNSARVQRKQSRIRRGNSLGDYFPK